MKVPKAFARQVADTIAGKLRWATPRPPANPLTKAALAELADLRANPHEGDAYGRHLASGNDFLSRITREHQPPTTGDSDDGKIDND